MPIFKDRRGRVIGDAIDYELYNDDDDDNNQPPVGDAELPGVHTDETGGDFRFRDPRSGSSAAGVGTSSHYTSRDGASG